jgi:putative transposase
VRACCQARTELARSSFYYQPCGESAYKLGLMLLLGEEFTQRNFKGVRGLRDHLRLAGHLVNEKARAPDGSRGSLP